MRDEIEAALASAAVFTRASRVLLEILRDLADAGPEARDKVRRELERREAKPISKSAFGQRLKRLNDELTKVKPPLRIMSDRGEFGLDDGSTAVAERIEEKGRASELQSYGAVTAYAVRAPMDEWLVFFSYAWQTKSEQRIQIEFFERVQRELESPPNKYRHLPKIRIWRDVPEIERSMHHHPQVDAACEQAFLALVIISQRYPGRPPSGSSISSSTKTARRRPANRSWSSLTIASQRI